jgi:superfamily II DNA or RNA helicase
MMTKDPAARLTFHDGMLWLDGNPGQLTAEQYVKRHPTGRWMAPAHEFSRLLAFSQQNGIEIEDRAGQFIVSNTTVHCELLDPFDFQKEAIHAWVSAGRRGIIVLPTGAGKSFMTRLLIARVAIEDASCSSLIVVPTRALLYQWYAQLQAAFGEEIGMVGDDIFDLYPITVTTYASARVHMNHIGNRWKLVVFDEVHRKMGRGASSQAARFCLAPYRLGLTATPVGHEMSFLAELIGPIVYEKTTEEMIEREVLSVFEKRLVHLSPSEEEVAEFRRLKQPMEDLWMSAKAAHRVQDSAWLVREQWYRPDEAALAQRAQFQAVRYWQSIPSRFNRLEEILKKHLHDHILIFTESRQAAYEISRRFLIPAVTADIDADERSLYLTAFAQGTCRALVTAKALEEGIDLPDANVAVILAGGSRSRKDPISYIQRRGRILRRRQGKKALVYEISWSAPP